MYGLQTPCFKNENCGQGGEQRGEVQLVQGKEKLDYRGQKLIAKSR